MTKSVGSLLKTNISFDKISIQYVSNYSGKQNSFVFICALIDHHMRKVVQLSGEMNDI